MLSYITEHQEMGILEFKTYSVNFLCKSNILHCTDIQHFLSKRNIMMQEISPVVFSSATINTTQQATIYRGLYNSNFTQVSEKLFLFHRMLHFHLLRFFFQIFSVSVAFVAVVNTSLTPSFVLAEHSR